MEMQVGWRIHLTRAFASAISYETKAGRNRLTLRFARPFVQASSTLAGAAWRGSRNEHPTTTGIGVLGCPQDSAP
jgi:hypothetical protein